MKLRARSLLWQVDEADAGAWAEASVTYDTAPLEWQSSGARPLACVAAPPVGQWVELRFALAAPPAQDVKTVFALTSSAAWDGTMRCVARAVCVCVCVVVLRIC